jgi:hypothetical protein
MITNIPDTFSERFPYLQPLTSPYTQHTGYKDPITNNIILYRSSPIDLRKEKTYYQDIFQNHSNVVVVFPQTLPKAKIDTYNKNGFTAYRENEFQINTNHFLFENTDHLPRSTVPNTSWSGDKGSACEDQFFRNTSYAIPDNNRYNETFRDPNGKPYQAMSDAFCPITGQHIEIKSRGLNTHPDKATCEAMTNKLHQSGTYDKFTALWHSWSHNIYKQHGVSQKLQDKFVILFPDNALVSGKLSDLDESRMLALDIDYDTFSGYQQRINNNLTSYFPNLDSVSPNMRIH